MSFQSIQNLLIPIGIAAKLGVKTKNAKGKRKI